MNIKQAKEEIKHTVMAYLAKGRVPYPCNQTASDSFDGTAGYWKDTDHGTDRHGM